MRATVSSSIARGAALFVILWTVTGCGYDAVPVTVELQTIAAGSGNTDFLSLRGTTDPATSEFSDGLMLSTRWSTGDPTAPVVELLIDINRGERPASLEPGRTPVTLSGPSPGKPLNVMSSAVMVITSLVQGPLTVISV